MNWSCRDAHGPRFVPRYPGTAPLPAETVTVLPTCANHPGNLAFGACSSCLRDARERAAKAEGERDAARHALAALAPFVQHQGECARVPCSCGLDAAWTRAREGGT